MTYDFDKLDAELAAAKGAAYEAHATAERLQRLAQKGDANREIVAVKNALWSAMKKLNAIAERAMKARAIALNEESLNEESLDAK